MSKASLLEVKNLKKYFPVKSNFLFSKNKEFVKAVDGISFNIYEGETFGLVGESGSGKSTTGRMLLRLIEPTEGEIWFQGKNLTQLSDEEIRLMRREMQMIFQDPYASLNPRMTVGEIIAEPLTIFESLSKKEKEKRVGELLELVGLNHYHSKRYPHEFSGGQRQRIGIARALAINPKLVIGDEPVSALDVSIQSQVLNLMKDLQERLNLTYLFIAHDLSVVEFISDRIGVMYLGKIVELADKNRLFANPLHPYTKALLSAVPIPDPTIKRERIILEGDIPSPANPPSGCTFHTRCPLVMDICKQEIPIWKEIESEHFVACNLYNEK
ncbi:ABC transporter ATP-binding protein [Tepidibacillus sp. HK-1]|uniref:ABC transporter ATP-binding protein n=1 Tax=Tepidibacillus sp. HK-1 TaxID=1883407 RepID=UPI000852EA93|nr:dipeptide ABC transporter ATP-binding protein [Tepidibacillus sp. HK-1]GBF10065.1 oligopeptide transport ATP-binding protein OppF [Tepidibacillus sp. HK-1]